MMPHVSKDTLLTEKMHLNISADKSQQVSVMYICEGHETVYSFYSKKT